MKKYCFGIDVGGTTVKCGLFDVEGKVLDKWEIPTRTEEEGAHILTDVAEAIEKCINEYYPGVPVHIEHAEGLAECKKALMLAKAGRMNGCLIEGMGCPGGCVAGAGTNISIPKAQKEVKSLVKNSSKALPGKELVEIQLD